MKLPAVSYPFILLFLLIISTLAHAQTPGGSAFQLQYNNSGSFGGVANSNATAGGNIGIGTSQSTNLLDVAGSVSIGTAYAGNYISPTNGLIVQGNVGVGSVNPGQALDVDGTVRASLSVNTPALSNLTTNGFVQTSGENGTLGINPATFVSPYQNFAMEDSGAGTIVSPHSFTAGSWTVEMYINPTGAGSMNGALLASQAGTGTTIFTIYYNLSQTRFEMDNQGSIAVITGSGVNFTNGTYTHVAFTFDGSKVTTWINGSLKDTYNSNAFGWPNFPGQTYTFNMPAYISGYRFSNTVRYTSAFTPPTSPFVVDGNTLLLFNANTLPLIEETGKAFTTTTTQVANAGAFTSPIALASNYIMKSYNQDNLSFASSSLLYDTGTNVGLGSTNPGQILDVQGTVRLTGFNLSTSPTNGYVLTSDANGNGAWAAGGSGTVNSGTSGQAAYYVSSTTAVSGTSNLIFNGSNVGVGSANPGQILDVQGTVRALSFSGTTFVPNNIQVFTTSGTWTKPTNVNSVYVKVWGSGGGGGVKVSGSPTLQGGFGGYSEGFTVVTGNVTVIVDQGGAGAPNTGGNGTSGGTTSFAGQTTIQVTGGTGGKSTTAGGQAAGGVGSGGQFNLNGFAGTGSVIGSLMGMGYSFANSVSSAVNAVGIGAGGQGDTTTGGNSGGNGAPGLVVVYY